MYKPLALFAVVCWLCITSGNGLYIVEVPHDDLDFHNAVYINLKFEHERKEFGFSPFGLEYLLRALSEGISMSWNSDKPNVFCQSLMRYHESLGTRESFAKIMQNDFRHVELRYINKIYGAEDIPFGIIMPQIEPPLSMSYGFIKRYSNLERRINKTMLNWSRGLIRNPIPPGSIGPDMSFLIMNTLTFQGNFKKPFQKSILDYDFYKNGKSIGEIPFLYLHDQLKYFYSSRTRSTIVEIPYREEGFSMIAILPNKGSSINETPMKMHLSHLLRLVDGAEKKDIVLQLPKFKIESSFRLRQALEQAYLPEEIKYYPPTEDPKVCSKRPEIRQAIFFAVEDTAPITEQLTNRTEETNPVLRFERPFSIVIRYKELILIMAEITDPTISLFQN